MLFVGLVLSAAASFRGASRCLEMVLGVFEWPVFSPSWFTGRLWVFRLGYYKLSRAKEVAEDWVWIVDHTVQVGVEKCLVILGIRVSCLPEEDCRLSHDQVEPITLVAVKHSDGEVVYQQLEETIEKTGIPREIIGDHGSDLKRGIEKFCQAHPQTCYIYDIKHKTAGLVKQELQEDKAWGEFTRLAAQTKQQVQQIPLAFLSPPQQRTKARYMNVDTLIEWGEKVVNFLDRVKSKACGVLDPAEVEAKLGWITWFRKPLRQWKELIEIVMTTEEFVRKQGLYRGCHVELKQRLIPLVHTRRTKKVCDQLVAFVAEESLKAKPNERLLGSSEVIESVFGKLKHLEQDQAKNGFTGLLLSVAAMVSPTTPEVVQKALETVSTQQVLDWSKETLGQTLQAKRREAFASGKKAEQKRDQFSVAV